MTSKTVSIANDFTVNRIGLGTNRIKNNDESKKALLKATDLGINFIDTAAAYTEGDSERVIGETLYPYPNNLIVATKGGMLPPNFSVNGNPEILKDQLSNSLKMLNVESIDLYFLHRVDPNFPFADQMSFLKKAQEEGKIKHIGLSEVSIEEIEEARKYFDVAAVENEYNLAEKKHDNVIDYCEKENIVFIPFYPLKIEDENALKPLKEKHKATSQQIALAWLLKRSPIMLPIPGSLSEEHLEQNVKSLGIELTNEDFKKLS